MEQDEFELTPAGRREFSEPPDDGDEEWPLQAGERHHTEYSAGRSRNRPVSGPRDEVVEQTEQSGLLESVAATDGGDEPDD